MATFDPVTVPSNGTVNVSSTLGLTDGDEYVMENVGGANVQYAQYAANPAVFVGHLLRPGGVAYLTEEEGAPLRAFSNGTGQILLSDA